MATTTTFWAIRDNYTRLIEARQPTELPQHAYRRAPLHISLRQYASEVGSPSLRKFEIHRTDIAVDPESFDPSAFPRDEMAMMSVAYPIAPGLYGREDLNDIECVIEADAKLLREVLLSAANYLPGQSLGNPDIRPIDKSSDAVWFQDFLIKLIYTEAQTIT